MIRKRKRPGLLLARCKMDNVLFQPLVTAVRYDGFDLAATDTHIRQIRVIQRLELRDSGTLLAAHDGILTDRCPN